VFFLRSEFPTYEVVMKLYWAPHSRAIRAIWLLEEIGRPYERVLVDIRHGGQNDAEFSRANPLKKVPALVDEGICVAESAAICAYLADKFPETRLAPRLDDPLRGPYLQWLFFVAANMEPAFLQRAMNLQVDPIQAGWGSFERVIGVIEDAIADREWLLGTQFSAADILMATGLYFGMNVMSVVPKTPVLVDYIARAGARPALQRASAIDSGEA
jgi:glutathione S-transferase